MASSSAPNTKSSSCFRWENQPEKLMKSFKSLRSKGRFTDVTLAANGKYLSAHSVILSAYSSYFEELLSLHTERQTIVFLQDVAFDVLQMLVDFMYNGEIEVECGKIVSFFDTAQTLKIRDLMHHQVPIASIPRVSLQIPNRQREAKCPAQASGHESHQSKQASSDGIVHLLQEHNKLPSGDNAVDINSLSQSSVGERILTEDSDSVFEFGRLLYEGSDSEDHSIAVNNEEILAPRHELYHLGDELVSAVASNKSWKAQSSSKQVPKSFEVQDFNRVPSSIAINSPSSVLDLPKLVAKSHRKYTRLSWIHSAFTKIPTVSRLSRIRHSAFANNSPSSTLELPKLVAKNCRKRTGLCRMRRLCSEKQFKAQRKRNVLKVSPGMGTRDNNANLGGATNDETSSATSQYEQIEAPELPGTLFEDSGTTGNEANDLELTGPSGIANQTSGQGVSNASSRFGLGKRPSAVISEPSNTGSLPGTSRSESSTREPFASSSASSSAQSSNSKPSSPTIPHDRTQNFVCQRCSKGCTSQGTLLAHQRLYCGEKPSFECVTSNKRIHTKNNLKTNRDCVRNSTEFVCHRCSKSYKWPSNLMRHECWECGKEPTFACVTCDKRFHFEDSLKKHCARVHKSCDI